MAKKSAHPGFASVQKSIQKEGYSKEAAGAILASASRNASPEAKKANPRLARVKGDTPGTGDNERPESRKEMKQEAMMEKRNGNKEAEAKGGTRGSISGGAMGDYHAKRSKM